MDTEIGLTDGVPIPAKSWRLIQLEEQRQAVEDARVEAGRQERAEQLAEAAFKARLMALHLQGEVVSVQDVLERERLGVTVEQMFEAALQAADREDAREDAAAGRTGRVATDVEVLRPEPAPPVPKSKRAPARPGWRKRLRKWLAAHPAPASRSRAPEPAGDDIPVYITRYTHEGT